MSQDDRQEKNCNGMKNYNDNEIDSKMLRYKAGAGKDRCRLGQGLHCMEDTAGHTAELEMLDVRLGKTLTAGR